MDSYTPQNINGNANGEESNWLALEMFLTMCRCIAIAKSNRGNDSVHTDFITINFNCLKLIQFDGEDLRTHIISQLARL